MFDVWLPTGPVTTHLRFFENRHVAVVLQCPVDQVERLVVDGQLDQLGHRHFSAFDPQDVADLVAQRVEAKQLSSLALYVLRLVLDGRFEVDASCDELGAPLTLVRVLDAVALHSNQGSGDAKTLCTTARLPEARIQGLQQNAQMHSGWRG